MNHGYLLLGAALFLLVSKVAMADAGTGDQTLPKVRIALVGDSTVTAKVGWGNGFIACLSDRAEASNLSAAGRSSMSFMNEGRWKHCLELKPDYVLIQFGHNDQKLNDPALGTVPNTTFRKYITEYIDEARAAGIKPILVTSLSRREWGSDGKIHSTLFDYVNVVKAIAAEKNVPLIDLHARSIELYEKIGVAGTEKLSPHKASTQPSDEGKMIIDNTHLNAKGSAVIGKLVAEELAKAVPELAAYVKITQKTAADR